MLGIGRRLRGRVDAGVDGGVVRRMLSMLRSRGAGRGGGEMI